jgi:hypothetical protein
VPRRRPRGEEHRPRGGLHGRHEIIDRDLGERDPVRVRVGDQVEGDVDVAGIRRHGAGVLIDRVFLQRVDLCRLGRSPSGADILGHGLELRRCAAGEETRAPSRANARATAPPIDPPPP